MEQCVKESQFSSAADTDQEQCYMQLAIYRALANHFCYEAFWWGLAYHEEFGMRPQAEILQNSTAQRSLYVPPVQHPTILRSAHTVFMCFVWIWEQTAITSMYSIDWLVFVTETECVYCAVRSTFYVLPTRCIYVFCVDLRTNSDYFTVQHWLVGFCNWDGVCLLRGTFYILRSTHTVHLCVLCGSENKQRLFHCTALTGWFL